MLIKKLLLFATLISSLGALHVVHDSHPVHAADLSQFKAGRIIDDQVFFDPNGLSVNEIQSFLNAKVPVCDTNGAQNTSYYYNAATGEVNNDNDTWDGDQWVSTSRATYGKRVDDWKLKIGEASAGSIAPYTCLKNYLQQTSTKYADSFCKGYPASYKTAAEIIHAVAQSCGVNPRALIVLLQKEQGLVTDDWPWGVQYRSATGYGCPDTAPCDAEYYGFFNQVYNAARQFKRYAAYNSEYSYRAYRNNYIQWNPSASCGGSDVYIENYATSGLYIYTPYRPNQAALNAGYGNGDSCSAYGNRNFWLYYTDWFGSTTKPSYWWQPDSQGVFTDETKTTPVNLQNVVAGTRVYMTVRVKNDGASTWYRGSVNLAASQPNDRQSSLYDGTWVSRNRAATINEASVAPGQYATFGFWANIPSAGEYREYFNVVAEGVAWMNDNGLYYYIKSQAPRYSWQPNEQKVYSDSLRQQLANTNQLKVGDRVYTRTKVLNNGNVPWYKNAITIGTSQPNDRYSALHGGQWLSTNRMATFNESVVKPGEVATFDSSMTMPSTGYKKEYFNLVAEGITWMPDLGMYYDFTVHPDTYTWQPFSQQAFTDSSKQTETNLSNVSVGNRYYLQVKVRNSGNTAWRKHNVNLATSLPKDRVSTFRDGSWVSGNRPTTLVEETVNPGDIGTFEFWVTAPSFSGERREYFNLVVEGIAWMPDLGMYYGFYR